jgi:hypothetical protein
MSVEIVDRIGIWVAVLMAFSAALYLAWRIMND